MGRNRGRNSCSLRPEFRAAPTTSQRVPDDVGPLRVSNQDDLLGRTRGDLVRELGLERGGSGCRRIGIVQEGSWVFDKIGGDVLGTVVFNGIDQCANDTWAGGFAGSSGCDDVNGRTSGARVE